MSNLDAIYGSWDSPRFTGDPLHDRLQGLWNVLAATNVGTPEFQPNFGLSQRKSEFIELATLFCRIKPMVIVEIGVAQGASAAAWCELAPDNATIILIDKCLDDSRPRPGEPVHPSIYHGPLKMASEGGGALCLGKRGQKVIGINGWTHDPAVQEQVLKVLDGRKVSFMFHDGSHHSRLFREDMIWIWPLIAPGGCLAIHDVSPSKHPDCDKGVVFEEARAFLDYSACYQFSGSRTDDSMGVGIFIK